MPVVRSVTRWKTRAGRGRAVRLYQSWENVKGRLSGRIKSGRGGLPIWQGLECDFVDWQDFRAWSIANGYSRIRCSLDREKSHLGYIKSNLRWVTPLQNSTFANLCGLKRQRELRAQAARNAGQQEWAAA